MNICFIGGGNMASAMIGGLIKRGHSPASIRAVEINAESRERLHNDYTIRATDELAPSLAHSNVVVLAVKPQQLREVALQMAPLLSGQLIISIAAGIRANDIARWTGTHNIIRAMPNTPALIRSGVTGLYAMQGVSEQQRDMAQQILLSVGSVLWLEEEAMMDAVTAVSGSGPAYFFYFIEALEQAGRGLGLPEQTARRLALETALGASRLAHESPEDPATLRARVTSKKGTTERALLSMEEHQVKQRIIDAVEAAAARSKELGDELGAG